MRGRLGLGTLLPRQTVRHRTRPYLPGLGHSATWTAAPDDESAVAAPEAATSARARADAAAGIIATAVRYAAWNWPVTPSPELAPTTDLERIFAGWTATPQARILAVCGVSFDVVEADASCAHPALRRLDRLGVQLGPVLITARGRLGFLVRVGTATALSALIDPRTGPSLLARGSLVELPRTLHQPQHLQRVHVSAAACWQRAPSAHRPALPAAHVVLGALTLAPHRDLVGSRTR
jgi:hypothetical protein